MASRKIPDAVRRQVRERAGGRCEYCQAAEWLMGIFFTLDHIIPRARDGGDEADNLCLACGSCNTYKHDHTTGVDPETKREAPLFHPRQQRWDEHFVWSDNGTQIIGLTPCGRATVERLKMNHALIVMARAIWVSVGRHPPF